MGYVTDCVSQVVLRPVLAADERSFLRLARESRDLHDPWVRLPSTSKSFATYLSRSERGVAACMVVCLKNQGDIVGMVNVNGIVRDPYQRGILGFAVFLPYIGRGYMSAGVSLAIHHAFTNLDLHRLEADIQPQNAASLRLVRRLGFRKEGLSPGFIKIAGCWRDHERWAITKDMELPAVPQG
ncbi:GNAT family protein [Streptomyces albogriseolus]|uniref:GNAT family N-acetyltransferase n=1 Tax=Streptomyces albogriseolus TaxID=1887 RepID=UPI00345FDD3D